MQTTNSRRAISLVTYCLGKMTGRIGDTPLVGAGGYADNEVGFDLSFLGVKIFLLIDPVTKQLFQYDIQTIFKKNIWPKTEVTVPILFILVLDEKKDNITLTNISLYKLYYLGWCSIYHRKK